MSEHESESAGKQLIADPTQIDTSQSWTRINVGGIWASELWPILKDDADLLKVHEACVNEWLTDNPGLRASKRRWRHADGCDSPFFFTSTDGAIMWVDARVDAARGIDDDRAVTHDALSTILYNDQIELPKSVEKFLCREIYRIEEQFSPQRETHVEWWRPGHSCH